MGLVDCWLFSKSTMTWYFLDGVVLSIYKWKRDCSYVCKLYPFFLKFTCSLACNTVNHRTPIDVNSFFFIPRYRDDPHKCTLKGVQVFLVFFFTVLEIKHMYTVEVQVCWPKHCRVFSSTTVPVLFPSPEYARDVILPRPSSSTVQVQYNSCSYTSKILFSLHTRKLECAMKNTRDAMYMSVARVHAPKNPSYRLH
jgi:hypothetical protein